MQQILMKKSLFILCFFLTTATLFAQTKKVVADKIIATVGDKIILKSDIDNSIHDMQRQGLDVPANADCLLLQQALAMKALVLQAEIDSIPVSDDDVNAEIDNRVRFYLSQYGSKEILEQIAGKSVFQLKQEMIPVFRDQLLAKGERDKITGDIKITPKERYIS